MLLYKAHGFTHTELYNMPVYLRRFYTEQYKEWREAENENSETAEQGQDQAYQQYKNTHQNPE